MKGHLWLFVISPILDRDTSFKVISLATSLSVTCQPPALIHAILFFLVHHIIISLSLSLSMPPFFPRQLRAPGGSLASQVGSPLTPIFPLTVNPSWARKLSVNHSFPPAHLLAPALCGMPLFYSVAHLRSYIYFPGQITSSFVSSALCFVLRTHVTSSITFSINSPQRTGKPAPTKARP